MPVEPQIAVALFRNLLRANPFSTKALRMSPDPILAKLRAGTGEAHARLEAEVRIEERVANVARYREVIEKFHGFYAPLEAQLSAWHHGVSDSGFDPGGRRKSPWLERDLHALGYNAGEIAALPRCERLPRVDGVACAWGIMYVLEGATLGGRHISALLRESAVPAGARTFFSSYGAAVGERWREFLAALEAFAQASAEHDDIVNAARETFASLHAWIGGTGEHLHPAAESAATVPAYGPVVSPKPGSPGNTAL